MSGHSGRETRVRPVEYRECSPTVSGPALTPTLILTPRHSEDAQALWRAAGRLGWDVERLTSWRIPDALRAVPEPVLYLEAMMAPMLAEQFGLQLIEPPADWLPNLPEPYRKRRVVLSTLGQARLLDEPAFVKPPNEKSFPAKVYRGRELPADYPDDTAVLVAEVVEWEKEFRCFVLDRRLRTFSVYLRNGELQRQNDLRNSEEEGAELRSFVALLLADNRVELEKTAVLDVGVIRGRGWAVIEQNAAWGSGLYGCDPAEVLEVLRYSAVRVATAGAAQGRAGTNAVSSAGSGGVRRLGAPSGLFSFR